MVVAAAGAARAMGEDQNLADTGTSLGIRDPAPRLHTVKAQKILSPLGQTMFVSPCSQALYISDPIAQASGLKSTLVVIGHFPGGLQ